MDTIFAVSSGAPPAAIAVLRISGAAAFPAVRALAGTLPDPRRAALRALHSPDSGALLDRALLLCFPGPRSATGEDLAELHLHGGRAVVRAVEATLEALDLNLRRAEPGEFTRRALTNGRIDLTEAEGLGDLLLAETETQRRAAVQASEGGVRRAVEGWAETALALAAEVEAQLDHSDEEDVAGSAASLDAVRHRAAALGDDIAAIVAQPPIERLRDGVRVVLAGPPNAGKSTLLNRMVEREAAIVSPIAGTTRDRIEVPVVRDGIAYVVTDTAGLRQDPGDAVEAAGVVRAQEALAAADVLLWLGDDAPPEHPAVIPLHARADLPGRESAGPGGRLAVSAATGLGMATLWASLAKRAEALMPKLDQVALNRRQRDLASRAAAALRAAGGESDLLIVAEQLRAALRAFDAITGRADVEAMLDSLFARFCIGK